MPFAETSVRRRLVFLTNIPAPYRLAFQNSLHEKLQKLGGELVVLYCADREPDRHWVIDWESQRYPYERLPGRTWHLGGWIGHWNPNVIPCLDRLQPAWMLVGGSWNMPGDYSGRFPGSVMVLGNE